jgi:hypothetical protein
MSATICPPGCGTCGGLTMTNAAHGHVEYTTITQIKQAHTESGGYFFAPSSMRFFGSRILSPVFPGGVFITSERDRPVITSAGYSEPAWGGQRRYTVRACRANGDIDTVSDFGQFPTRAAAVAWARGYAGTGATL